MTTSKLQQMTLKYAQEFRYWKDTAIQFFEIAEKQIKEALENSPSDADAVEGIADAWHKCMAAQWTLYKSGKQTANRMAERRGVVTQKQFHPAQLKKKKDGMAEKVDQVLENN